MFFSFVAQLSQTPSSIPFEFPTISKVFSRHILVGRGPSQNPHERLTMPHFPQNAKNKNIFKNQKSKGKKPGKIAETEQTKKVRARRWKQPINHASPPHHVRIFQSHALLQPPRCASPFRSVHQHHRPPIKPISSTRFSKVASSCAIYSNNLTSDFLSHFHKSPCNIRPAFVSVSARRTFDAFESAC